MTCVLGMVVSREREIRNFVKIPYYKVIGKFGEQEKMHLVQNGKWEKNQYYGIRQNSIMNQVLKGKMMQRNL